MKDIIKLILCVLLLTMGHVLFAQQKLSVKGRVLDEKGTALAGVNISIKGDATKNTRTGVNGHFTIHAVEKDTILFELMGFQQARLSVKEVQAGPIILNTDLKELDEVVVIAYGEVKKSDFTGSLGEINVEDINKAPVPNIGEALAGRVAGLQVSSSDGQPGNEVDMVIRGGSSITQSNSPLFVVDGVPMDDFSMSSLNPEEIEFINILKDASATAMYGSRAANGVVIIETKKGKESHPVVTYNGYYGLQKQTKTIELMDTYEFVKFQAEWAPNLWGKLYLTDEGVTLDAYKYAPTLDWQSRLFRTAPMQNHAMAVRGGNKTTKYSVSGNIIDQDGVIIASGFRRYQGRINIEQDLSKKLKMDVKVSYSNDRNHGQISNQQASSTTAYATYLMYRVWGYRPISTGGGDLAQDLEDDIQGDEGAPRLINPITSTENEFRQKTGNNLMANLGFVYKLPWNMKLNVRGGYTNRVIRNEYFNNSKTYRGYNWPSNSKGVHGGFSENTLSYWDNENILSYNKTIQADHKIDAVAGFTMQGRNTDMYSFEAVRVPSEELGMRALSMGIPSDTKAPASSSTIVSFLGRVNYAYKGKYMLTASFRSDGSSRFVKKNRWGYFPAFAAAWDMKKEGFLDDIDILSQSKLRASWGAVGNNNVNDFAAYSTGTLDGYYGIGTGSATPSYAFTISNFGNKDLKWETTYQLDLGYEVSFYKNRVNLVVDYYDKRTKDLLMNANVPFASGFAKIYKNIGSIQNRGFEFTLNTQNIRTKKFQWNSSLNISFNDNKVLALTEDEKSLFTNVSFTSQYSSSNLYLAQVGRPVSSFYGLIWEGVYGVNDFDLLSNGTYVLKAGVTTNGNDRSAIQPGDIKYKDVNGDKVVNEKDRVIIGRTLPKHFGGFNNDFVYKNFGLNVFFQWNYGNDIMNANRLVFEGNTVGRSHLNQYASYVDRWSFDNQDSKNFRTRGGGPMGYFSTRTLEDGSFIRLKTVQLTYRIPKNWVRSVSSIELNTSAQNLFTWSKYTGLDPEVSTRNSILTPGFDYSAYARNFTISFGGKIIF